MHRSVANFCETVRQKAIGDIDQALWDVVRLVDAINCQHDSVARIFACRDLDNVCQTLGSSLLPTGHSVGEPKNDHIVYLATGLAPTGGHTRVILDLIQSEPATQKTIIISNTLPNTHTAVSGLHTDAAIEIAPDDATISSKVRWVQERLGALRPRKTYLILHPFDAVHVAAVQPELVGHLIFLHNYDHGLALGVGLDHATHVDFHAKGFWRCREVDGVRNSNIIPLAAEDQGHRTNRPFFVSGHLTTCCSGGLEKFEFDRLRNPWRYRYDYTEGVAEILGATNGTHLHIGPLSPPTLDRIRGSLARAGLPLERFVHIPQTPNLWKALLDHAVDVYVGSFPYGGGRATVEAMGAGLPLLIHSNYRSHFLSVEFEVYDGAMIWRDYQELVSHLQRLDLEQLLDHAQRSRRYYEQHHTMKCLSEALTRVADGVVPEVPKPHFLPNVFQCYLDEHPELVG